MIRRVSFLAGSVAIVAGCVSAQDTVASSSSVNPTESFATSTTLAVTTSAPITSTTTTVTTPVSTIPETTLALVEPDLSNVEFSDKGLEPILRSTMEDGVAALWQLVEPYTRERGLTAFPASRITGYPSADDVVSICGAVDGCAFPGEAHISMESRLSITGAAHEAAHVVQYAMRNSVPEPRWLSEGSVEWYAQRAVESHPVQQVSFEFVLEDLKTYLAQQQKDDLPSLNDLATRSGFNSFDTTLAYPVSFAAFDLLLQIEGGEVPGSHAYFEFLSTIDQVGWRDAFSSAFSLDYESFLDRFATYVEGGLIDDG